MSSDCPRHDACSFAFSPPSLLLVQHEIISELSTLDDIIVKATDISDYVKKLVDQRTVLMNDILVKVNDILDNVKEHHYTLTNVGMIMDLGN